MGTHLLAVVGESKSGRIYVSPDGTHTAAAAVERPSTEGEAQLPVRALGFRVQNYGFHKWFDLFTNRQLVALTTFSDLVGQARQRVLEDALAAGMEEGESLEAGGSGARAYADAIATYLALAVSRQTDRLSSIASWQSIGEKIRNVFARQAIPMVWDFAEANPFSSSSGNFFGQVKWIAEVIERLPADSAGNARQLSADVRDYTGLVVSTDPPYYDNIGYSDLSDFFYVWLRRCLQGIHPSVVSTMLTPKAEELVANPYRHDGQENAAKFFVDGFNTVFHRIRRGTNPDVPMTVYYAYKQQDNGKDGKTSTGWHTLLDGLIGAGWEVTATWPVRSERGGRMLSVGTNALASSIVLACRPRPGDAPTTTQRAFVQRMKSELPGALRTLMQGDIAPVDLAQAAIGPGIAVFSRYARVRSASGGDIGAREALELINRTLDEVLGEQESEFDPDTRFAVRWYRQYGWRPEQSGIADQLARTTQTSIAELQRGGIFTTAGGKGRLLSIRELDAQWDPASDSRLSIWEATFRLAALLESKGLEKVAELVANLPADIPLSAIKELGFLLFHEAERKGDGADAQALNALVTSWGDVSLKARQPVRTRHLTQEDPMAPTNRERIDRGFALLSEGLLDLVDPVMTEAFGSEDWPTRMAEADARKHGGRMRTLSKTDPQVQLRAITEWGRSFAGALSRSRLGTARGPQPVGARRTIQERAGAAGPGHHGAAAARRERPRLRRRRRGDQAGTAAHHAVQASGQRVPAARRRQTGGRGRAHRLARPHPPPRGDHAGFLRLRRVRRRPAHGRHR